MKFKKFIFMLNPQANQLLSPPGHPVRAGGIFTSVPCITRGHTAPLLGCISCQKFLGVFLQVRLPGSTSSWGPHQQQSGLRRRQLHSGCPLLGSASGGLTRLDGGEQACFCLWDIRNTSANNFPF